MKAFRAITRYVVQFLYKENIKEKIIFSKKIANKYSNASKQIKPIINTCRLSFLFIKKKYE